MSIETCAARRAMRRPARETLHRRGQRLVLAIEAHRSRDGRTIEARTLDVRCPSSGLARASIPIFERLRRQNPAQPPHVALQQAIDYASAGYAQAIKRSRGERLGGPR